MIVYWYNQLDFDLNGILFFSVEIYYFFFQINNEIMPIYFQKEYIFIFNKKKY